MEIFTQDGLAMLSRWGHFLAGITWIGLLYYFNFVQTPAFVQMGAPARSEAMDKVTWRALWWFRWAALFTFLTGVLLLLLQDQFTMDYLTSAQGTAILTGAILGTVMLLNVWAVIWRKQQIVIGSARRVLAGGEADPAAAPAGRQAALASRQNTIFSIPLLFFMGAASHFAGRAAFDAAPPDNALIGYWVVFLIVAGAMELNALGLIGGTAPGMLRRPYDSVRAAIITGLVLLVIFYVSFEVFLRA
jgi:uncharacterized membrane protein